MRSGAWQGKAGKATHSAMRSGEALCGETGHGPIKRRGERQRERTAMEPYDLYEEFEFDDGDGSVRVGESLVNDVVVFAESGPSTMAIAMSIEHAEAFMATMRKAIEVAHEAREWGQERTGVEAAPVP